MSTEERPAKRVRQACDPCRRKKSRCPGERPICSYCARLRQQCTYSDKSVTGRQNVGNATILSTPARTLQAVSASSPQHDTSDTTQRLNDLETKLSEVLVALHESRQDNHGGQSTSPSSLVPQSTSSTQPVTRQSDSGQVPRAIIEQATELYLTYCHCQPLPLFTPDDFPVRLLSQSEEVIYAVLALALRFSSLTSTRYDIPELVRTYTRKARSLALDHVRYGPIELSTLQSLCLLSWLEFYEGNSHRASLYASLASDLCMSSNLAGKPSASDPFQEDKLRCFWSVVLLQRLHPNVSGPLYICFDEDNAPPYPKSESRPNDITTANRPVADTRAFDHRDPGITACAIQLTGVWHKVTRYAHRRASAGPHPPWSPESEYAKIIAYQMENEAALPYIKHRFKPAKFEERTPEELLRHRGYWGPWLFTQILYHTIMCVLNHPLLLYLRLKNFRVASVPEIWLQHTDDLISQHSQWIIVILDTLENKSFFVSDPFIAHCVAIVATIHLQQSFGGDGDIREAKHENFEKCLRFCQKAGNYWPHIQQIAQKLQAFGRVVSNSHLNSATVQSSHKVFIDLSLFWEILESAAISEKPDANGVMFGQSLRPAPQPVLAAEELSTRLLPETARVAAAGSPTNGLILQSTPSSAQNAVFLTDDQQYSTNDDFAVLAQSYFAQGQDFVGNMDDWWLMEEPSQPI